MLQDGGWVELLGAEDDRVLARGHVMFRQVAEGGDADAGPLTERSQVVAGGGWTGRLDSLHLDDVAGLAEGRYRLRFERNGEELPVELTSWSEADEEASVRSVNGELPTVLLEVGGPLVTTTPDGGTRGEVDGTSNELIEAFLSEDCEVVAEAATRLSRVRAQLPLESLEAVERCLAEATDPPTRMALASASVLLAPQEDRFEVAHRLLHGGDGFVREAVFAALADLADSASVAAMEQFVSDPDRDLRWGAFHAVAHHEYEDPATRDAAIALLVHGLHDDDFAIRWTSSSGLIGIGSASTIPILEALVTEEPTTPFHEAARRVLSRIEVGARVDRAREGAGAPRR